MNIIVGTIFFDEDKNGYKIQSFIKKGGFGSVYKAIREDTGDFYAIKTLNAPSVDEKEIKSFINDGKLAATIKSKNIIDYKYFHDGNEYSHLPIYIIMEYANNGDLGDFIDTQKKTNKMFSNDELKNIFYQIANGMKAINEHLVHRDLKPENILLSDDVIKICDFGLAKIVDKVTRNTTFKGFGSVQYYPPEAWKFDKNTIQMDIYSVGLIFYELATLQNAYQVNSNDNRKWQEAHMFQNVEPPINQNKKLSPTINQIILKMIEKSPNNRYKNWDEIIKLLDAENLPQTNNSDLVNLMIKKRTEQVQEESRIELQKKKTEEEKLELRKIIRYQLENDIIVPIKKFIEEFNSKSSSGSIRFNSDFFRGELSVPSGNYFHLEIEPVFKHDFIKKIHYENQNSKRISRIDYDLPKINNEIIVAWGLIRSNTSKGFNIILAKNDTEVYGKWYLLLNTDSGLGGRLKKLPSPFAFDLKELKKEVSMIRVVDVINRKLIPFDIEYIKKFITEMI